MVKAEIKQNFPELFHEKPQKNELFTLNTIVLLTPNWSPADVKFRKNLYHQQVDSEKGPE